MPLGFLWGQVKHVCGQEHVLPWGKRSGKMPTASWSTACYVWAGPDCIWGT